MYKNILSAQKIKDICEEHDIHVNQQVMNFNGQMLLLWYRQIEIQAKIILTYSSFMQ